MYQNFVFWEYLLFKVVYSYFLQLISATIGSSSKLQEFSMAATLEIVTILGYLHEDSCIESPNIIGKVWGLRAKGLRKYSIIFYCRPTKKDSIIYFGTIAREAVAAKPQVGYIIVHFIFPFLKND